MLASLTVTSDERLQPLVDAFGREFAGAAGLAPHDCARLVRAVDAAVRFVRERAYPGDPTGRIEVRLEPAERGVRAALHDWGRPLISAEGAEVGVDLGAAEDVRLINLGAEGKRLTFLWPASHTATVVPAAAEAPRPEPAADLTVRDATVEDAEAIAQLLYGNYHLSYVHPDFYRPRWLREQLASDGVRSTVALHGAEVVGHHALLPAPGAPVAETGIAVVDPAFRGMGVFGRMSDHTLARARTDGLHAVYGRAVTMHPYSQRSELAHGYRETALCLGASPGQVTMRGLGTAIADRRRTALLISFLPLRRVPRRAALPERHRRQLLDTYAALGLQPPKAPPPGSLPSAVTVERQPKTSVAVITVRGWDERRFTAARRELLAEHFDVVYVDLDLEATVDVDAAVEGLREHGFTYAGLWLHGPGDHDHLRLQRLNCTDVELDAIATASDAGRGLVDYVLADLADRTPARLAGHHVGDDH